MSKYIPEIKNISHYRIVFIFKMSCPKAPLLRILPVSYARIQLPSPKRSNPVGFLIGGIKVPSIIPITSAFIGTIAKRKMPVEKIVLYGVKCASCPTCNQTCPDFEKDALVNKK